MVLRFSFNLSGIVLNAPTTMGITYVLTPHICRISLAKSRYLSTFSSSFSLTLPLSGIATSIIWQLFSFLSMINRSGLLASISWSAPILNLFTYLKFIYLFIYYYYYYCYYYYDYYYYYCCYVYTFSVQLVASSRYRSRLPTLVVENPSEDSCCP